MSTDSHAVLTEKVGPVRLSRADKTGLEELARRNERTVPAEVRLAIRDRLDNDRRGRGSK